MVRKHFSTKVPLARLAGLSRGSAGNSDHHVVSRRPATRKGRGTDCRRDSARLIRPCTFGFRLLRWFVLDGYADSQSFLQACVGRGSAHGYCSCVFSRASAVGYGRRGARRGYDQIDRCRPAARKCRRTGGQSNGVGHARLRVECHGCNGRTAGE